MLDLKFHWGKGLQKKAVAVSLTLCMVLGGMYVDVKASDTTNALQTQQKFVGDEQTSDEQTPETGTSDEQTPENGTTDQQTPDENQTVPVESICLDCNQKLLPIGKTLELEATVAPEDATNQDVTWTTSDDGIASVTDEGLVTAKMGGEATITAISKDNSAITAICKITVPQVAMNASNVVLQVGTTTSAVKVLSCFPTTDKVASYKSSNTKFVKVDSTGKLTAVKIGAAKITVTMVSGATTTYNVVVQKKEVVTKSLKFNDERITLKAGAKKTLVVKRNPITAAEQLTWTSSNESIATVDANGKVTAVSAGTTTITASVNGKKATCKVTVPAAITLKGASAKLKVGATATIEIKSQTLASDKVASYQSDNKKVATVDKKGHVKTKAKGKAVITVTMKSGATATYTVAVK